MPLEVIVIECSEVIPEITELLYNKPGQYHRLEMSFTDEEFEELSRRGLMDVYTYFGKSEALIIRSRVMSTLGKYAAENSFGQFDQSITDQVTIRWVEQLQKGRIVSIVRMLEKVLLMM